jgi:hypothetical protein
MSKSAAKYFSNMYCNFPLIVLNWQIKGVLEFLPQGGCFDVALVL